MGHRFVPISTIQRRMASRDRRLARALAPRLKAMKAASIDEIAMMVRQRLGVSAEPVSPDAEKTET